MTGVEVRLIISWILAAWPRRSKRRNPIEEVHAFFAERLTEFGKHAGFLWLASLVVAMLPGSAGKVLLPLLTAVLLVSLVATWRSPALKAVLLAKGLAVAGSDVELLFRLENCGDQTIEGAGVGLCRAREGVGTGEVFGVLSRLEVGCSADVAVRVTCRSRGPTGFAGVAVMRVDRLGLARARRIDFSPVELFVAPAPLRVVPGRFLFGGARGAKFSEAVGFGSDSERVFLGVRAFREGDRLRDLDHKAWARWSSPIVREFGSSHKSGIVVVVETGCDGLLERSLLEPMLRLAAATAVEFCRNGWLAGLVIDGTDAMVRLDAPESVLAVMASIPRCGWGPWRKGGMEIGDGGARGPVLVVGVSPRLARQAEGEALRKCLIVVAHPPAQAMPSVSRADRGAEVTKVLSDVVQVSVATIASGEVAL